MNIVQISERLKGVPKDFLIKEANPATSSGRYPAFLVISELSRRNATAKQFKNAEAMTQIAQPTVTDKTINEASQPPMGIASMTPQSTPTPTMAAAAQGIKSPTITAKEGGMIKYDEPTGQETMGIPGAVRMYEGGRVSFNQGGELRKRLDELDAEIAKFMQTNKALPVNLIRQRENILNTLKPTTDQTELPGEEDLLQDIVPVGVQSKNVNPRARALQNQTELPDNQGITSNRDLLRPRGGEGQLVSGIESALGSALDVNPTLLRKNQIEKMLEEGKSGIRGLPLSNEKRAELEAELATLNKQLQPEKETTSEMEMTGKIPTYLLNEEARKELEETKITKPETDTKVTDTKVTEPVTEPEKIDKPEKVDEPKVDPLSFDSIANEATNLMSSIRDKFGGATEDILPPDFVAFKARSPKEFLEQRNQLRKVDIVAGHEKLIDELKDQNEKDRLRGLDMFILQSGLSILSAPSQGRGLGAELSVLAKAIGAPLNQLQKTLQVVRQGERDITKAQMGLLQVINQQQEGDVRAFDAELTKERESEVSTRNMMARATFDLARDNKKLNNDVIKLGFNLANNIAATRARLEDSALNRKSREEILDKQIKTQKEIASLTVQNKFNVNNIKTVDNQIKVLNKSILDAQADKITSVGKAIGEDQKAAIAAEWDALIARYTIQLNGLAERRDELAAGGGNVGITPGEAGQGIPYKNLFDFSQSKPSKSGNMYVPYQMPR